MELSKYYYDTEWSDELDRIYRWVQVKEEELMQLEVGDDDLQEEALQWAGNQRKLMLTQACEELKGLLTVEDLQKQSWEKKVELVLNIGRSAMAHEWQDL